MEADPYAIVVVVAERRVITTETERIPIRMTEVLPAEPAVVAPAAVPPAEISTPELPAITKPAVVDTTVAKIAAIAETTIISAIVATVRAPFSPYAIAKAVPANLTVLEPITAPFSPYAIAKAIPTNLTVLEPITTPFSPHAVAKAIPTGLPVIDTIAAPIRSPVTTHGLCPIKYFIAETSAVAATIAATSAQVTPISTLLSPTYAGGRCGD